MLPSNVCFETQSFSHIQFKHWHSDNFLTQAQLMSSCPVTRVRNQLHYCPVKCYILNPENRATRLVSTPPLPRKHNLQQTTYSRKGLHVFRISSRKQVIQVQCSCIHGVSALEHIFRFSAHRLLHTSKNDNDTNDTVRSHVQLMHTSSIIIKFLTKQ